jgi:putative endonuclease
MNYKAQLGLEGEEAASTFLLNQGYEIVEKNYRYRHSEIDIIAKKDGLLIFVEVKTKSYDAFGNPELSVDEKKVLKVQQGAEHYILDKDWRGDIRFDVIAIIKLKDAFDIKHFEDAFY